MGVLRTSIDLFLHIDVHLQAVIARFGPLTYALLFLIIFCETGLVVLPFLPGDSLLFAAGAFAARGSFSIGMLIPLIIAAAVCGDSTNYVIGAFVGPHFFLRWKLLKQQHLDRAHAFFEKYGRKAQILARFMPIIRTIAPFTAGIARMTYPRFLANSILGGVLWVSLFTLAGYFFGNIPAVEHNFSLVILAVIILSILPAVVEYARHRGRG